jgi:hypothetical protein
MNLHSERMIQFTLVTNNSQLNIEHNNTITKAKELAGELTGIDIKGKVTLKQKNSDRSGYGRRKQ